MTKVRVLVGTQKGGFVLSSDGRRRDWDVAGPLFGGWEVYHMAASPADPDRLYASQSTGWFGQVVQRSDDGGSTWQPVGNEFVYEGGTGTHQWYDGSPHPWEFARVWHLEASASDPDSVLAGVEDAALFRSSDGGATWSEVSALRTHEFGAALAAGGGGHGGPHGARGPGRPRPDARGDLGGGGVPHRRRRVHLAAGQQRPAL